MSLPIVAIVGRPNVGKSTMVNRLAENNEAIVHEMRGVTRDRSYHNADWNGRAFTLIDTGGIEMGSDDAFQSSITSQALAATDEADVIVFLVDGQTGINADDEEVARILRRSKKPVLLAVNKLDSIKQEGEIWEFYQLGLGDPRPVSALHGTGTGDLLDEIVSLFPEDKVEEDELDSINVAIIGRPNAGKSSLLNCLLPTEYAETGMVSERLRRGRHTTRYVRLLPLSWDPAGGMLADTPGFFVLDAPAAVDQDMLPRLYPEYLRLQDAADGCRFDGCRHDREPGFAVRSAVAAGGLDEVRYQRYLRILHEIQTREVRY